MNKHYNKVLFQGDKNSKHKRYFEGWYYKQVNKEASFTISFIPGVSYNKVDPHCFIQCIICNEKSELSSHYFKYDLKAFAFQDSPFLVKIDKSIFNEDMISINIEDPEMSIQGEIYFENRKALQSTPFNPNIMGFFSYIPKMECNHHIISMNHTLSGNLKINDKKIDLNQGLGYIEKDWGTSFPSEYIWLQCNHFDKPNVSIAFSVANIPFLGFSFKGFFCSLLIDDKEYRFATYNNSKLKINYVKDGKVNLNLSKGSLKLKIVGNIDKVQSLASPKNGMMNDSIKEGLAGHISLQLEDRKNNLDIMTKGVSAGLELMMEI